MKLLGKYNSDDGEVFFLLNLSDVKDSRDEHGFAFIYTTNLFAWTKAGCNT